MPVKQSKADIAKQFLQELQEYQQTLLGIAALDLDMMSGEALEELVEKVIKSGDTLDHLFAELTSAS